jgi:hypothetical protein
MMLMVNGGWRDSLHRVLDVSGSWPRLVHHKLERAFKLVLGRLDGLLVHWPD